MNKTGHGVFPIVKFAAANVDQSYYSALPAPLHEDVIVVNQDLRPVVLSNVGRALTEEQSATNGKHWVFHFLKSWKYTTRTGCSWTNDRIVHQPIGQET